MMVFRCAQCTLQSRPKVVGGANSSHQFQSATAAQTQIRWDENEVPQMKFRPRVTKSVPYFWLYQLIKFHIHHSHSDKHKLHKETLRSCANVWRIRTFDGDRIPNFRLRTFLVTINVKRSDSFELEGNGFFGRAGKKSLDHYKQQLRANHYVEETIPFGLFVVRCLIHFSTSLFCRHFHPSNDFVWADSIKCKQIASKWNTLCFKPNLNVTKHTRWNEANQAVSLSSLHLPFSAIDFYIYCVKPEVQMAKEKTERTQTGRRQRLKGSKKKQERKGVKCN